MSDRAYVGRTAIVTGAGRGIGLEIARHLGRCGARVALFSRSRSEVDSAVVEIQRESTEEVWGAVLDVKSPVEVHQFAIESATRLGPADIVVNNAAVLGPVGRLGLSEAGAWSNALDINVKGVAFVVAAFREQLESSDMGRVVNLSGGGVGGPNPMMQVSAYLTSKYAVAGLTEALANEFAGSPVTVNAIAPGAVATSFLDGVVQVGPEVAGVELFTQASSRRGALVPADLKPFLLVLDYLLSDSAAHISGRLLSGRWETPETLGSLGRDGADSNLYKLRRIDDSLFSRRLQ